MPELDDALLERRLRGVLQEHLDVLPLDLTVDVLDRRREAKGVARRSGRGRSMALLAAAALLLVGGALAVGSGLLRLPTVIPPVPEPSVVAIATASPDATFPSPSASVAPSASPIPVAGLGGVWIPVGSMVTPGGAHAVRLLDGRVLVLGGDGPEVYDPATGTWSATGQMVGDGGETATLLRDGKVLITGYDGAAQLYDPATGTWSATGRMIANHGETATLLRDGKVLITGYDGAAQLYDPATGTWSATGKMNTPRIHPAATLLSDGRVLVAGGEVSPHDPVDAAEVYDPVTGSWTEIADMQAGHYSGIATQLPDGKVLVAAPMGSEVYDPTTGTWTDLAMPVDFGVPRALLSDQSVLLAPLGNIADGCTAAALFDLRTGSLSTISSMLGCGYGSSFTLLLDGTVLKAGGDDCNDQGQCISNGAAELYVPAGVPMPPFSFPSPPPPVFPDPTPTPTPAPLLPLLPPADGPVPPNARSWTITVENDSSEPATMFVAEGEAGAFRLVGSATPNVVPAGSSMEVTFLFPAKGIPDDGWLSVNPRLGEGADVGGVGADNIGMPGKIWITEEGDSGWVGPAQ